YSGVPPDLFYLEIGLLSPTGNLSWVVQDSTLKYCYAYNVLGLASKTFFVSGSLSQLILHDTLNGTTGASCFLAILNGISGNKEVCAGTINTYSVPPIEGASSYTWILPAGWSGNSTTNSIVATVGSAGGE